MADKQLVQLIKPIANMQASIFAVAKGEDILSWLNKFDLIAAKISGLKKSKVIQHLCTWTNERSSITTHCQNKQKQISNW